MAKGTIQRIVVDRGFGFIHPDGGGDEVFFHRSKLQGVRFENLKEDTPVTFESERGDQGLRATVVRVAGAMSQSQSQSSTAPQTKRPTDASLPQGASHALGDAYRFLNPYNFIRYLGRPKSEPDYDHPEMQQLWRCPPPPHDRYVGLSGCITCEAEAITPLFISDSHAVEKQDHKGKQHPTYRFFEYGGQPALPPTSLRGMVRSVFEAVTNSCLAVFETDDEGEKIDRLEHRLSSDPGLVPVRVHSIDTTSVKLEPLDCSTKAPDKKLITIKTGIVSAYEPVVLKRQGANAIPFSHRGVLSSSFQDGERVAAMVNRKPAIKYRKNKQGQEFPIYQYYRVEAIVPAKDHNKLPATPGCDKVFGYIHVTGPNIENKHDERLFFRWDDNKPEPHSSYKLGTFELNIKVVQEYNRIVGKYWDRHGKRVEDLTKAGWPETGDDLPHPSTFVREGRKLAEGDLVYYFADELGVDHLVPVSMPRIPYRHPREKFIPEHIKHCLAKPPSKAVASLSSEESALPDLCPACRVFGWVANEKDLHPDAITAYAGRVNFSHGALQLKPGETVKQRQMENMTLAILGSPKPTTTQFYLVKQQPDGRVRPDSDIDYDDESFRIRGRKSYRHQSQPDPQEYRRATDAKHDGRDDQNRTVRGAMRPGTTFTFTIDFHNLAPAELGALLWSLELKEKDWQGYHRLGFAKPLGFGSLKIKVTGLETINPAVRYTSVDNDGKKKDLDSKEGWIELFRREFSKLYGQDFAKLDNVRDLMALAGPSPELPIHYPRPPHRDHGQVVPTPDPEGKNFEWFVGNKRSNRKLTLPLAVEDTEGFPLMDRTGRLYEE